MKVELIENCLSLIQDVNFINGWRNLCTTCIWTTPFQTPEFVCAWFQVYKDIYSPIVISLRNEKHILIGLLVLGKSIHNGKLVVAGAHQAEYQCWISSPDCSNIFPEMALRELQRARFNTEIKFKYLPEKMSGEHLYRLQQKLKFIELVEHRRPLMEFDADEIEKRFRKKSNRSRFNRLKRLGNLQFIKVTNVADFAKYFNRIINYYDLRQGSTNSSFPFQHDTNKKVFHFELMKRNPELLHITIAMLDGQLISAHIGIINKDTVHLAILANSPFYASHSPGKLHLMQLSKLLVEENINYLDLTPGGDTWKERFSNFHDTVYELVIYDARYKKIIHNLKSRALYILKSCLNYFGITPNHIRSVIASLSNSSVGHVSSWRHYFIPKLVELKIYRHTTESAKAFAASGRMKVDDLSNLLMFASEKYKQDIRAFCSTIIYRLNNGEHNYSFSTDERLLHYGWLSKAKQTTYFAEVQQEYQYLPNSVVLHDFYTDPRIQNQSLYFENIGLMLSDATTQEDVEYIYISQNAKKITACDAIEKHGFEYLESLVTFKILGYKRKWNRKAQSKIGDGV